MLCLIATTGFTTLCPGQYPGGAWEQVAIDHSSLPSNYGAYLASGYEIDGDGFDEYAVFFSYDWTFNWTFGSVELHSGQNTNFLWDFQGPSNLFGSSLPTNLHIIGDLNVDGIPEVLVGWPDASPDSPTYDDRGAVCILSGADGSLIESLLGQPSSVLVGEEFGSGVAPLNDVDFDGFPDFAVGARSSTPDWNHNRFGRVGVYSGQTRQLLWEKRGDSDSVYLGERVANAGDFNRDGVDDVLVSVPHYPTGNTNRPGRIEILSASNGQLLQFYERVTDGSDFGEVMQCLGDVDGDQVPDHVIAMPGESNQGKTSCGAAFLYSGASGSVLWSDFGARDGDNFGFAVARLPDLDWDGVNDVAISAIHARNGQGVGKAGIVKILSGASGNQIWRLRGTKYGGGFGRSLATGKNPKGDNPISLYVGEPTYDNLGRVHKYDFNTFLRASEKTLSAATGGTVDYQIDFPDSEALKKYVLLASASGIDRTPLGSIEIPLRADHLYYRMLSGQAPIYFQNAFGVLDANGDATATLDVPANTLNAWAGRTLYGVALSYDQDTRLCSIPYPLNIMP
ncbi:MAG: hypothetical protein DWQ01_08970 [Planctomycetota bacterium]|nr:MAG: hypothetical protein DWQ01_08970 [Planctomycetota bacterium]